MKRISYLSLAFAAVVALGLVVSSLAIAADGRDCTPPVNTPVPNSAVIHERVFNDCPSSTVASLNAYPLVRISDTDFDCVGGANLHIWSFSEDGITPAVFENCSHYKFGAVFTGSGVGVSEGGLRLSPWWSLDVDGRFMCRINGNGEIACFGGRLPFYSFTGAYGITYAPGTPIWLGIEYNPHTLANGDPATIVYTVLYNGNTYVSPYLPFDQGTATEDPPHGLFGELYPARAGGYCQLGGAGGAVVSMDALWTDISFVGPSATPASHPTWGQLKTLYR